MESVLFGSLVIIPTTYLDALGVALEFWRYPVKLLPFTPRAIPFDMLLVPVALMLLHQYFGTWASFCVSLVIMSLVYAFIGEPLSTWLGLVKYVNWKYEYSFFYYVILGLLIRSVILKVRKHQI